MVVTSSMGIVPPWKWGPEWCQLNWLNVIDFYQFWEQLSVNDGDGIPSGLVLVNFLSSDLDSRYDSRIERGHCTI